MLQKVNSIKFMIVIYILLNVTIAAEFGIGNLTLKQVIKASEIIANATPYKKVDKKLPGTIVNIEGKKYEIRYFSFNDARLRLSKKITFKKYAYKNKLLGLRSMTSSPVKNIHFETFDYKMANIRDGEFFSISLRVIE